MAYERKPGDIAIFAERQKKSDKAPDWKGELLTPSGEKLQVALWFKSDTMLAGRVEPPRQKQDDGERFPGRSAGRMAGSDRDVPERGFSPDLDDEIPF